MKKPDRSAAMEKYIAEIDRFATMLSSQQIEITKLMLEQERAKARYDSAKEAVREAKDYEHETVALLLKFITPGSIDILPLFDTMDAPDEEKQGKNSTEWRKEPITSLGLSAAAMRALIGVDVVLVGQLQDLILKGAEWSKEMEEINDGMAQAIEAKLHAFIEERTGK